MASRQRRAVGIFPDRPRTASALQALSDSGFSMRDVSVIAHNASKQAAIAGVEVKSNLSNHADDGGAVGALAGGVLGGVTGLLVALGTIVIPGVGPALLAGETAAVLATLVGGAAGAVAGGLVGALIGLGIPEKRAREYSDRVTQGNYLILLRGSEPEIYRAEQALQRLGVEDWGVYGPPTHDVFPDRGNPRLEQDRQRGDRDAHRQSAQTGIFLDRTLRDRPDPQQPVSRSDRTAVVPTSRLDLEPMSERRVFVPATSPVDAAPALPGEKRAIGIFLERQVLETALDALRMNGFPTQKLSIAVRDGQHQNSFTNPFTRGDRSRQTLPASEHSLEGVTALLSNLERVDIPHTGTLAIMGPDAASVAHAVRGNGAQNLTDALKHLAISDEQANLYGRHLMNGAYLVTLRGSDQEMLQAASVLGQHGMRDWGIYDLRYS